MNWWSETSVLWLPVAARPNSADFAERSSPGASDFYYYALDAFEAITRHRLQEFQREPWAYTLDDRKILSPGEIDQLMDEWRAQILMENAVKIVGAAGDRHEPRSVRP